MRVLIVSLGSTEGLRRADEELRAALERAAARVSLVSAEPPPPARTLMLTDLGWARAARAAALRGLAEARPRGSHRRARAGGGGPEGSGDGSGQGGDWPALIYSSATAALMWPRPGAIRFDALAAGNRPGRHGLWQRPLERRRLEQAPLLLPWSAGALEEAGATAGAAAARAAAVERGERALVLPVPVEPSGPLTPAAGRDVAAITYAANPVKKGLDRVLAAWRAVRAQGAAGDGELVVAGAGADELARAGFGLEAQERVRAVGALAQDEYRALLRRARVFVCAPRREDHGLAQLEALADGCMLVTTPAPGPYAALPIARSLDPRLVGEDLAGALRVALEDPHAGYAERAREALAPLSRAAVDRVVADELLPALRRP